MRGLDHAKFLLGDCLHLEKAWLHSVVPGERRVKRDCRRLLLAGFESTQESHALLLALSFLHGIHTVSEGGGTRLSAYVSHLRTDDGCFDFPVPLGVCDEGVWVVRHIHPQKCRFLRNRIPWHGRQL